MTLAAAAAAAQAASPCAPELTGAGGLTLCGTWTVHWYEGSPSEDIWIGGLAPGIVKWPRLPPAPDGTGGGSDIEYVQEVMFGTDVATVFFYEDSSGAVNEIRPMTIRPQADGIYLLDLDDPEHPGEIDVTLLLRPWPPLLSPPLSSSFPTFTCIGDKCLYTWGQLANAATLRPALQMLGSPTSGRDAFGLRVASSFLGVAEALGPGIQQSIFDTCPVFQSPVDHTSIAALQFFSNLNIPKRCGTAGATTAGLHGVSDFGALKAYASVSADAYPFTQSPAQRNEIGFTAQTIAGVADVLLFKEDTRRPGDVVNDRTVVYTFRIDGTGATQAGDAFADAAFFFRGAQGPCPMSPSCVAFFGDWLGPGRQSAPALEVALPYEFEESYLTGFELLAVSMLASNPDSPAPALDGSAIANFAATATLARIQLFEGTPVNRGPEITGFRIISGSGTDYNEFVASLVCDVDADRDVDLDDLRQIRAANRRVPSAGDPRDSNRDGRINVADVRFCQLRLGAAPQ